MTLTSTTSSQIFLQCPICQIQEFNTIVPLAIYIVVMKYVQTSVGCGWQCNQDIILVYIACISTIDLTSINFDT